MGNWKLLINPKLFDINKWVLIDLSKDVEERNNLTAKHPHGHRTKPTERLLRRTCQSKR